MPLEVKRPEVIRVKDTELGLQDGDDEIVYCLRPITKAVMRAQIAARKQALRQARSSEERAALGDENDWMFDYALVSWEGVLFGGQPAECTSEMKRAFANNDVLRVDLLLRRAGMTQVAAQEAQQQQSFR
jgi:hypothetical protein